MFHPQGPTFFELARQALTSTQKGYDLLAPKFDYTPFRTPDSIMSCVKSTLEQNAPFERGLDVCCGTGVGLELLSEVCSGTITGIDFSAGMLEQAKRNLADSNHSMDRFEFLQRDVFEMDFQETFDLAVCFGALGHILPKQEDAFIARIAASLRPGGRFVFVTSTYPSPLSFSFWAAHGFNAAMRVRNLIVRPPFIMYYLTFLWPAIDVKLKRHGLQSVSHQPFAGRAKIVRIVEAIKKDSD